MSSDKKIEASRASAKKSTGPINTNFTRYNATRHGLLTAGVTELDDAAGYYAILEGLMHDYAPVGTMEVFFVESMALYMVRSKRAQFLEASYITSQINPPQYERPFAHLDLLNRGAVLDPGLPASILPGSMQCLVGNYQRYETHFTICFLGLSKSSIRCSGCAKPSGSLRAASLTLPLATRAEHLPRFLQHRHGRKFHRAMAQVYRKRLWSITLTPGEMAPPAPISSRRMFFQPTKRTLRRPL